MIWFLFPIVTLYYSVQEIWLCGGYRQPESFLGYLFTGVFILFITALATLAACGVAFAVGYMFKRTATQDGEVPLVALRSNDGVAGGFFLGTGLIESTLYYFFYKGLGDGGFTPDKMQANDRVRVYEREGETPKMVTWSWSFVTPAAMLVAMPPDGPYACDFIVPPGTIQREFKL